LRQSVPGSDGAQNARSPSFLVRAALLDQPLVVGVAAVLDQVAPLALARRVHGGEFQECWGLNMTV